MLGKREPVFHCDQARPENQAMTEMTKPLYIGVYVCARLTHTNHIRLIWEILSFLSSGSRSDPSIVIIEKSEPIVAPRAFVPIWLQPEPFQFLDQLLPLADEFA